MEVILASSSKDADICCWDLHTGAEQLRYKSCPSPSHGLTSIGGRYLASSQLPAAAAAASDSTTSSASLQYWSWNKPQSEVKSFPPEPINPIVSNKDGSFIIGGGSQGNIYLWEVARGRLLKKWHAHIRAVTCLVLSDDESLLISGAEDGYVRVWSLFKVFDDTRRREAGDRPYEHNLFGHSLRVTDIVSGHGGCNAIIVSSSEDRTCKVWSLSKGELLRSIDFPTIINAITLDPFEHVFYAGGNNGKIYIASLNGESSSSNNYGLHIMGALSDHSKAVTCLTRSMKGDLIISGSEDQTIRIWDRKSQKTVHVFKHAKGPVSSVYVTRSFNVNPQSSAMTQGSVSRRHALLPPSLNKYVNSAEDNAILGPVITLQAPCTETPDVVYHSHRVMENQIKQLQQEGSSGASQMELEKLRLELEKSLQREEQWKKMYSVCVNELLDDSQTGDQMKATTEPLTPETTKPEKSKKKKKTKPEKSKKRKKTTS